MRLSIVLVVATIMAAANATRTFAQPNINMTSRVPTSQQGGENLAGVRTNQIVREEMVSEGIPGLQLVIAKNAHIIFSHAYGVQDETTKHAVTRATLFPINSISKAFTGVEVIVLAEHGKLALNAPVSTYLRGLPTSWETLTINQLLSHTSGLPEIVNDNSELLGGGNEETAWKTAEGLPLRFAPGTKFEYCQTNYALLQRILEEVSGQTYGTLIRNDQAEPAKARSITVQHGDQRVRGQVPVYTFLKLRTRGFETVGVEKTSTLMLRDEPIPQLVEAAGGIVSSGDDLARWAIALQDRKIIHSKTGMAALWSPIPLKDGKYEGLDDTANAYTAGWPLIQRALHPAYAAEGGERAALFIYPKDGVTVIVLTNLMGASPQTFIDRIASSYIPNLQHDR